MGIFLPAESLLITVSIYCSSGRGGLDINIVALSAITGAIMGDNFGYIIGRKLGYPILKKYGPKIKLTHERLLLGQYLFRNHGGKVVFFGRFFAILRFFTALLAGANRMPWKGFLAYNALGGVVWAGGYSYAAYFLGKELLKFEGRIGIWLGILGAICVITAFIFLRRNEQKLIKRAESDAKLKNYS